MNKKTLKDLNVFNKKVIVRVDFNVPIVDNKITDDNRIIEAIPTIKYLLENGAAVILMSHLGRPDGKFDKKFSLKPCAERLSELMKIDVKMSNDVVGKDSKLLAKNLKNGGILLLENLRFEKGEEENDEDFSKELAQLADLYVNDAFGTAHRKHASTYGIAKFLPSGVGFLIQKELDVILGTINKPKRPFVGILGGAKVADKLTMIDSLLDSCDTLIVGGGMAYTFLKAMGYKIGTSLLDESKIESAKKLMEKAHLKGVEFLLPLDFVAAPNFNDEKNFIVTKDRNIPNGYMGMDIGPQTIELFEKAIKNAKTVIWNGPVGVFEKEVYAKGTFAVAKALTKVKGTTIIGGGDVTSAVINMGLQKKITHISTGGGASLKLFEGKMLPAVEVISDK